MTIKERATTAERRVEELRLRQKLEMERVSLELRLIQMECQHPNRYEYSIMGRDTGTKCPDCLQSW